MRLPRNFARFTCPSATETAEGKWHWDAPARSMGLVAGKTVFEGSLQRVDVDRLLENSRMLSFVALMNVYSLALGSKNIPPNSRVETKLFINANDLRVILSPAYLLSYSSRAFFAHARP